MSPRNSFDPPSPSGETAFSKSSVIELSLVLSLLAAVAAGSVWATKITVGMEALRTRTAEDNLEHKLALKELRDTVMLGTSDRWTLVDMQRWIMQANREVEIWSRAAEQQMGLPADTWLRFEFPDALSD